MMWISLCLTIFLASAILCLPQPDIDCQDPKFESTQICRSAENSTMGENDDDLRPPTIKQLYTGRRQHAFLLPELATAIDFMSSWHKLKTKMATLSNIRSPEFAHASFLAQVQGAPEAEDFALTAWATAVAITDKNDVNSALVSSKLSNFNIAGTIFQQNCPAVPMCRPNARYRSFDGSCNNLFNPKLGMAMTPLKRLLPNKYDDGLGSPRTRSALGGPLPSTRLISNILTTLIPNENDRFTAMLVSFGQFVDHDLDFVPVASNDQNEPIDCCSLAETPNLSHEAEMLCFPIRVPPNDPIYGGRRSCINVVRSVGAVPLTCLPGPINQLNQVTHWLDSSNVYGSSNVVASSLREFDRGLLKTVRCLDGDECLPFTNSQTCRGPSGRCALAGDLRVNEQPTLGLMHLLFVREHNRIAKGLRSINPRWNDETLYQETRRIVNAEYQHILYNEFLESLLGPIPALRPLKAGFRDNYDAKLDPRVSNEFAAAGFRIGHTFITEFIKFFSSTFQFTNQLQLRKVFQNADLIRGSNVFDQMLRGLTNQPAESFDNSFVDSVKNSLFDDVTVGIDLIAINMQRGRDHGLPSYTEYLKLNEMKDISTFGDLSINIPPERISQLQRAYKSVHDIDLFIGMILERPCKNSFVGCTFLFIIADVFDRVRHADRFYYDLKGQPGSLTAAELREIRKSSMARLLCDNSNLGKVTTLPFELPNTRKNPFVSCNAIPRIDLNVFGGNPRIPLSVGEEADPGDYAERTKRQFDYIYE